MKTGTPEICSGTYLPLRGRPTRGYYVAVGDLVLAGPFARRYEAQAWLKGLSARSTYLPLSRTVISKELGGAYAQSIRTVLSEQAKALASALRAAS